MKKNIFKTRALAFLMAIVLVGASITLVGCGGGDNNTDTDTSETTVVTTASSDDATTDTEGPESTENDEPASQESEITIFSDGKLNVDIVIHDNASTVISGAANDIKNSFANNLNVTPNVRKESMFKTLNEGTLDVPKIVVGAIKGDAYCDTLLSQLGDRDHIIAVANKTLYIIGKSDASTAVAVNKFIYFYVKRGITTLSFEAGELTDITEDYNAITIAGNPIVEYSIVYYDSYYAKKCAEDVQSIVEQKLGFAPPLIPESSSEREYEILVGKTGRSETKAIRAEYDRPNVYYDVKTVDNKLIVLGEGYRTLTKIDNALVSYIDSAESNENLTGEIITGDILSEVDAVDCMTDALVKDDSADFRVLHWNMAAPLAWDQSGAAWGAKWTFAPNAIGWKQRAEQQADVVLIYNPDIITTNELYNYHGDGIQYQTFKKELSDYFIEVDSTYDARDDDKPLNVPETVVAHAENPEKIFIRKGMFNVKDSGWRYLSDGTTYHGIHWAILETVADGKQFIVSGAHYSDATTEVTYGSEHLSAIRFAQRCSGSGAVLPVILTGDMFTWVNHHPSSFGATYFYLESNGYNDSQVKAAKNCNDLHGTIHGTYHDPTDDSAKTRASEDFVWYNNKLTALKFGVITLPESTNTSDHWPVFADLSLK